MKMMKVHIGLWLTLLIGGFLLGFVPQYQKNRELQIQSKKTIDDLQIKNGQLQTELQNPAVKALHLQVQLGELRDIASLMLLELSRQNYGLARDYSTQYYSKLREALEAVQDENLKKSLEELALTHDALTASLAVTTSNSSTVLQALVSKTFEVTRTAK